MTKPTLEHLSAAAAMCPSCGSRKTRSLGEIPPSRAFAGRTLDKVLPGGSLWRCHACRLLFRYPRPAKAELDALYQGGHEESWADAAQLRADWQLLRQWLETRHDIKRIIDIGCFDGRLLEYLGAGYGRYGVEIHEGAARRAREHGIDILGHDFSSLPPLDAPMDLALAIDVIEHSLDPRAFLKAMAAYVRPGGFVAVATGNTQAASWRLMGSRYWYCHIAEHMSFVNPEWARRTGPALGLELADTRLFSHAANQTGRKRKMFEVLANLVLRVSPRLFAFLRRTGSGSIDIDRHPALALTPTYWMSARDHMILVFRKIG